MKKYNYLIGALLVASLAACSGEKDTAKKGNTDKKPVVRIEKVNMRDVDQLATYTATAEPELINNISSSTPNRIKQIYVDEGMRVSKGQKLVVLDDVNSTAYEIQLDNAKASLINIEANYRRAVELYNIGGGTKQQVEQMETQLINARNAVTAAERNLRNIRENTVLVSPISGVITKRNYDPGDMTGTLPILTVAQVNPLKLVINVSESELPMIKKGMRADVKFDTYGDELFQGTITMVSPTVDAASRTFGVEVTLPNSDGRVLPGMFGRVTLNLGNKAHVVVPDLAVIKQPGSGNHYVYIYENGKVSYVKVELGQRLDNAYELISGVPDGADVVVSGHTKLANGMEVELSK